MNYVDGYVLPLLEHNIEAGGDCLKYLNVTRGIGVQKMYRWKHAF
jgi:hypothetical protein